MSQPPTGRSSAAFALFALVSLFVQPRVTRAEGEIYWFTLLSDNVYVAMDFYTEMFGWQIDSSPAGGLLALRDGQPLAGLNEIAKRAPDVSESLWLAAITVDDPAASVAAARRLGATIHEVTTNTGTATPDFELTSPRQLALLSFRYRPEGATDEAVLDQINERLLNALNDSGKVYLTQTRVRGRYVIRLNIGQTATERRHVEAAWTLIRETARGLGQLRATE